MLAAILRFVALGSLCGAASAAALPLATSLRTDWRGNLTTYAYDDANRLQTRTEPLQKVTTYGYDGLGNVKRETDAENGVTLHDYDGLSRRIKTTDAELGDTFFKYDGNGNKVETTDAEGRIAKHEYDGLDRLHRALADTTGENAVTVYDYDKNGNVIGVTDPNNFKTIHTYDENNRKETTRDPLTFETRFEYDKVGNKKLERNARGYARGWDYDELNRTKLVQDETGQQTAYEYDKVGNRTEERWPNGNIVTHRYDELNRRKSANDRVGLVGEWKYDAQGNLETETSGNGHITTHLYDELNRRYETRAPSAAGMRILAFTHDKLGNVKTERDANGNVTTHDYDKLNRLRRTFDAIGDRYLATYDKVGNKKTETDANGFVDTHTYDGLNRRIKTTDLLAGATSTVMEAAFDKAGNKLSEKDANLRETTYKYDAMNRLETVTRAGVLMVKNEYDPVGNLRFVTDALGNKVGYQYDARSFRFQEDRALGAITRFTPTAMADVAEVLDAEGRKTVNTYDFRRRLETVTNGASELTRYGYDLNGNRTSVQKPKGTNFFQNFEYDAANRLVKVTTPAGASELTYDLHGNLIRRKDALNHSTAYSDFDARNRRRLTTFADTKTEATTYDGVGNVKTLRDSNGATTTYTYDERHRERFKRYSASVDGLTEIETTYDAVGNVKTTKETYGAATRLHQRDYDAFNRLEREVDAWNDEVRHTYDLQGNRKTTTAQGATTLYGYDELNRRKSVTTAAGVTELEYDRTNLPTAVRYPNGVVSTTTYDRAMRVETVKHAKGATTLESVAHTYDFNGNRKTQTRVAGALTENTTYDYDFDDWLTGTTVTKTDGAGTSTQGIVYTLDAVGNRKREDSTATGLDAAAKTYAKVFTVDERDRVRNVATTGAGAGTTAYVYDDNGNLTSKSGSTGSKTYVWNVRDRLVEVRDGATPIARYKYNAEGLRDEVEGERRTTWVNGFAYLDKTPASGLLAKYETHPNGRSPILAVSPAGTEFLHSDALGSSTLSTNNAGTTNAATTYDEWGNSITTGATINKFGYTGHETDHNTGLVYFKARHYDPELGKFISADPFEGTPNYPVTWNGYLYANGNPLVWIDRDGYESIKENFGLDDRSIENSIKADGNVHAKAAWHATKQTAYEVWNFATGGFLKRQDNRREKYDRGEISEQDFDRGTGFDASTSILAQAVGGAVGGRVATLTQTARPLLQAGASGAAFAGTVNAVEQSGQVLTHAATDGQLGRAELDPTEMAAHAAGGFAFAGGLKAAEPLGRKALQIAKDGTEAVVTKVKGFFVKEANDLGHAAGATVAIKGAPAQLDPAGRAGDIRARIESNIAETQAATRDIDVGLVTMDLRALTTIAANRVDTLGARAFTPRQLRAIQGNSALEPAFRGNRIDVRVRAAVEEDPLLSSLQSNYTRGADFRDLRTRRWWDMTTPQQWGAHVRKYGPGGTILPTQ